MTGERCRHCGGQIEYVPEDWSYFAPWWQHVDLPVYPPHEAAPAFGGGS